MTEQEQKAKSIFLNALEIASEDERRSYMEAQCGDDAALRREVEELVWHQAHAGSFLERGSSGHAAATVDAPPMAEKPGTVIGPYKLLQQIGEGGMGVVYLAEQREPVDRRVALKIIKPGMDTRQVIGRFEAERHALAMMDHPNIARVLDPGNTDSGRPSFVMELVKGVPITQYCDEHHLTPEQRLEIFVPVCQAVQNAIRRGSSSVTSNSPGLVVLQDFHRFLGSAEIIQALAQHTTAGKQNRTFVL